MSSFPFSFSQGEHDEIIKEINCLKTNKAPQTFPQNLLRKTDIFGDLIFENFKNSVFYSIFPSPMKNAIITPVCKKGTKTSKDNYRPVSILSNISKFYERLMFKQISEYFEPTLSKFQCGFGKGFSAQHCLKWVWCGLSLPALRLMQSYLSNRKQRTKINSEFSFWEETLFGVP